MGFDKSTITKSIITFFIRLNIVNYIPRAQDQFTVKTR